MTLYTIWVILIWAAVVGLVVSILWLLFSVWPERVFPPSRSSKREEIAADIKARNIVRLIIAVALAGAGFVATFVHSIISFNQDLRQRTDATISENYAKAIAQLGSSEQARWQTIGSLLLLAKIVDQDSTYHKLVFRMVAEYLISPDRTACKHELDKRSDYVISPEFNVAAQIFGDRNIHLDPPAFERLYNLDSICLSNAALLRAKGFHGAWMPGARLFRVDLREADLQNADLRGAEAGVIHMDTWGSAQMDYGYPDHNPIEAMSNGKNPDPHRLSRLWADFSRADFSRAKLDGAGFQGANFEKAIFEGTSMPGARLEMAILRDAVFTDAVLTGAHFELAVLQGATFDGAHVTRTSFTNAIGLDPTAFATACVEAENDAKAKENQPTGITGLSKPIPRCTTCSTWAAWPVLGSLCELRRRLWRDP
jgi:uncharacterized protein YjbI with pentapeptide repeats